MTPINRPGNMENVYENRKTNEYGKIITYNDEFKTLIIQLSDGKTKSMSYSTFNGAWRKKAHTELIIEDQLKDEGFSAEEVEEIMASVECGRTLDASIERTLDARSEMKALTKSLNVYIASVRDKSTKELMTIEREYARKNDFYKDLRAENYSVRFISTPEKFDEDAKKWDAGNERSKRYHKARREAKK